MDIHKHDRRPDNGGPPTDHIGKLTDAEVGTEFGGRMIGARIRSIYKQMKEMRRWVNSRCAAFRIEGPGWTGLALTGAITPLTTGNTSINGHRINGGSFYCNRAGLYHISALYAAETATAGTIKDPRLALLVDGVWYSWLDIMTGTHDHWVLQGSDLVHLECGQRLQLGLFFDTGGTLANIDGTTGIGQTYGYFAGHWECDDCIDGPAIASIDTLNTSFGATAA
jgi:hypothetical protein